ncbi:hypothetical protein D9M68_391840 [compost metagenome]
MALEEELGDVALGVGELALEDVHESAFEVAAGVVLGFAGFFRTQAPVRLECPVHDRCQGLQAADFRVREGAVVLRLHQREDDSGACL